MSKKLDKLVDKMNKFHNKMRQDGEKLIKEAFTELFTQFPQLVAVGWTQYAPYFNDGDPCEFSVGSLQYRLKSDGDNEMDFDNPRCINDFEHEAYSEFNKSYRKDLENEEVHNAVCKLGRQIGVLEDVMKATFGDDNCIIVTPTAINILDYSGCHE